MSSKDVLERLIEDLEVRVRQGERHHILLKKISAVLDEMKIPNSAPGEPEEAVRRVRALMTALKDVKKRNETLNIANTKNRSIAEKALKERDVAREKYDIAIRERDEARETAKEWDAILRKVEDLLDGIGKDEETYNLVEALETIIAQHKEYEQTVGKLVAARNDSIKMVRARDENIVGLRDCNLALEEKVKELEKRNKCQAQTIMKQRSTLKDQKTVIDTQGRIINDLREEQRKLRALNHIKKPATKMPTFICVGSEEHPADQEEIDAITKAINEANSKGNNIIVCHHAIRMLTPEADEAIIRVQQEAAARKIRKIREEADVEETRLREQIDALQGTIDELNVLIKKNVHTIEAKNQKIRELQFKVAALGNIGEVADLDRSLERQEKVVQTLKKSHRP